MKEQSINQTAQATSPVSQQSDKPEITDDHLNWGNIRPGCCEQGHGEVTHIEIAV